MHSLSCKKLVYILVFFFSICEFSSLVSSTQENGLTTRSTYKRKSRKIHVYSNWTRNKVECSEVVNVNYSSQCYFVKTTPDCQLSDGFIQYLLLPYCLLPRVAAFCILFLWMVFLFVALGITADEFFCPCLIVISKTLKLSDNAAGVTFLAIGNGSPDIISAVIAILHSTVDPSSADLGIESLLGSGIFISMFLLGIISLISRNFIMSRGAFIRDISFCICSIIWVIIALYKQKITLWESTGMMILCVVYVVVVIGGLYTYQYWKRKKRNERILDIEDVDGGSINSSMELSQSGSKLLSETSPSNPSPSNPPDEKSSLVNNGILPAVKYSERPLKKLCHDLLPFTATDWQKAKLLSRVIMIIKAPAAFVLKLTTPLVDYTEPDRRWNKWLSVIHCITGPVFVVMAIEVGTDLIGGCFPVWALALCICGVIALIVALVTKHDKTPKHQWIFSFLAFVVSIVWMYVMANEIVGLLEIFGISLKLSGDILGLTFLAWGTSLGELVTSVALAKKGYPTMGASACFGGAMLNIMFGISISSTMLTMTQGQSVKIPHSGHQYIISAAFLLTSLVSSGIMIPLMGFKVPRLYGAYLIVLYIIYLIISVVTEAKYI